MSILGILNQMDWFRWFCHFYLFQSLTSFMLCLVRFGIGRFKIITFSVLRTFDANNCEHPDALPILFWNEEFFLSFLFWLGQFTFIFPILSTSAFSHCVFGIISVKLLISRLWRSWMRKCRVNTCIYIAIEINSNIKTWKTNCIAKSIRIVLHSVGRTVVLHSYRASYRFSHWQWLQGYHAFIESKIIKKRMRTGKCEMRKQGERDHWWMGNGKDFVNRNVITRCIKFVPQINSHPH